MPSKHRLEPSPAPRDPSKTLLLGKKKPLPDLTRWLHLYEHRRLHFGERRRSEALISKIETGRARPDRELKERIACVLAIKTWEVGI